MTDTSKAWVWASYQGVVRDDSAKEPTQTHGQIPAEDRVVPLRPLKNRSEAMGQNSTAARTKFGIAIAASVLVGAFFPLISFALFMIAVLQTLKNYGGRRGVNGDTHLDCGDLQPFYTFCCRFPEYDFVGFASRMVEALGVNTARRLLGPLG